MIVPTIDVRCAYLVSSISVASQLEIWRRERVGLYLCVNGIGSVDTRGVGGRVYAVLIQYMPSRLQLREKGYLLPVLTPSRRIRVHRQEICYLATSGQRWIGER